MEYERKGFGGGERKRKVFLKEKANRLKGKCRAALNSQHRLYTANSKDRHSRLWPSYPLSVSSSNLLSPVNASMHISAKIPESQSLVQTAFNHSAQS